MGLCFSSPLAEIPSRCSERPCGWMMCPHSMASCRISVFSQYRFVSDTIYRSRPGVWTPRSCLLLVSFISTILITKHPIWPQLWSLVLPVTVQHSELQCRWQPMRNALCFRCYYEGQMLPQTVQSDGRVSPVQLEVGQGFFPSFSWWILD